MRCGRPLTFRPELTDAKERQQAYQKQYRARRSQLNAQYRGHRKTRERLAPKPPGWCPIGPARQYSYGDMVDIRASQLTAPELARYYGLPLAAINRIRARRSHTKVLRDRMLKADLHELLEELAVFMEWIAARIAKKRGGPHLLPRPENLP